MLSMAISMALSQGDDGLWGIPPLESTIPSGRHALKSPLAGCLASYKGRTDDPPHDALHHYWPKFGDVGTAFLDQGTLLWHRAPCFGTCTRMWRKNSRKFTATNGAQGWQMPSKQSGTWLQLHCPTTSMALRCCQPCWRPQQLTLHQKAVATQARGGPNSLSPSIYSLVLSLNRGPAPVALPKSM